LWNLRSFDGGWRDFWADGRDLSQSHASVRIIITPYQTFADFCEGIIPIHLGSLLVSRMLLVSLLEHMHSSVLLQLWGEQDKMKRSLPG